MKRIVFGFVLVASGLGVGLALREQQVTAQEKDVTTNPVGTFQLAASGEHLHMLNTRSGEAWQIAIPGGRQWVELPDIGTAVPLKAADDTSKSEPKGGLQSDVDRLQGKWKVVSGISAGQAVPESQLGDWILGGEKMFASHLYQGKFPIDYRLDENHQPGWFDMILYHGEPVLGIYELNDNTLMICHGEKDSGDRPTTLESKAGSHNTLWVLQRE